MLLDYYNLRQQPFGVTPDPRFLYMSASHREALAALWQGIKSRRGFMSLLAQPGMGKTTILFHLVNQLKASARTAYLFQTLCRPEDLLRALLLDLGVTEHSGNMVGLQEQLNRVLWDEVRQGRTVVVVIDEAQNLDDSTLELVRMLSNFETTSEKLIQIVLAGQLQLRDKLASDGLVQLRQRISIGTRLSPFNAQDTHLYIEHRLRVAGYDFERPLFTPQAEALIARHSEGIPRNINNICFNALSLGRVLKQRTIEKNVVREVLNDLDIESESKEVSGLGWIAGKAIQPKNVLHALAWPSRVALLAVLLVALLSMSPVGRAAKPLAGTHMQAVSGHPSQGPVSLITENSDNSSGITGPPWKSKAPVPLVTENSNNSRRITGPAVKSETPVPWVAENSDNSRRTIGLAVKSETQFATEATSTQSKSTHVSSTTKSAVVRSGAGLAQPTNPATLWEQVKEGRSDAEVELARIYLNGTGREQNCEQARVLLQDASRRGNTQAADLLADSAHICH